MLENELIHKPVLTEDIFNSIIGSKFINEKKKKIASEYLLNLPNFLVPSRNIAELTVDFVIEDNSKLIFIEFHQKQHHTLSDYRLRPIYSNNGDRFEIPRFLQRLIKDYWRWKYLNNYKIVWHNWFVLNRSNNISFKEGLNEEFVLENKFSFLVF